MHMVIDMISMPYRIFELNDCLFLFYYSGLIMQQLRDAPIVGTDLTSIITG
jgi:hypothetical protein